MTCPECDHPTERHIGGSGSHLCPTCLGAERPCSCKESFNPKPYYADDSVTLYHGDCREITDWLAADVLVTDPPYGMGYEDRGGRTVENDETTATRDSALDRWGDVKPALIFGTWKVDRPPLTRQLLIWDKSQGNGTGSFLWSPWFPAHEEIYVLGEWPRITPGGRWREGGTPARESGVIRVSNYNTQANNRPDHPTPKPLALMERLIDRCPNGMIADPFAGAGSTLIAAKNLGRQAVGVEIDESYCELSARRLSQDVLVFDA